ncbi:hypothetical protein DSO57_1016154 [Entomophthora muscae]|uniref:Uncharacterized protein n=1 Tax=Entomophthora muscae TaxID=34485 RepID=A0ACC2T517_9FUNG|nr:hypothetical protein DSO57_1016154 [Entomophthora muscae]
MYALQFGPLAPSVGIDVAILVVGFVAVVLNLLLLRILLGERLAVDCGLMAIIGVLDLIVNVFMICSVVVRWSGYFLQESFSLCLASAVTFNSASVLTPMLVAQLSYVRYLAIVRGKVLGKLWIISSLAMVFSVWGMFIWRGLASELVLLPSGAYCTPLYWGFDITDQTFGITVILLVFPSLLVTPICYYHIMAHYRTTISFDGINGYFAHRQLKRHSIHVVLVMVAYGMAFMPELIHVFLTIAFDVPRTAMSDAIVMTLLFSMTITNALFTLLLHEDTRLSFSNILNTSALALKLQYPNHRN